MSTVDKALAAWPRERLRQRILQMAAQRPPGEQDRIEVGAIAVALIKESGIEPGPERGQAYARFVEAIKAHVAHIEGMTYIEGNT